MNSFLEKHRNKIQKLDNGCWIWTGSTAGKMGYGNVWCPYEGRMIRAHRASYAAEYGLIPNGLLCCHKCDNPKCVNPSHIFLGTQSDNIKDMYAKRRSKHRGWNISRINCGFRVVVQSNGIISRKSCSTFCEAVKVRSGFVSGLGG